MRKNPKQEKKILNGSETTHSVIRPLVSSIFLVVFPSRSAGLRNDGLEIGLHSRSRFSPMGDLALYRQEMPASKSL